MRVFATIFTTVNSLEGWPISSTLNRELLGIFGFISTRWSSLRLRAPIITRLGLSKIVMYNRLRRWFSIRGFMMCYRGRDWRQRPASSARHALQFNDLFDLHSADDKFSRATLP